MLVAWALDSWAGKIRCFSSNGRGGLEKKKWALWSKVLCAKDKWDDQKILLHLSAANFNKCFILIR